MTKTIKVSDEKHAELESIGNKGETFEDIIGKLLASYRKTSKH